MLVAEEGQSWDAVTVVRYPDRVAFSRMVADPDYQEVTRLHGGVDRRGAPGHHPLVLIRPDFSSFTSADDGHRLEPSGRRTSSTQQGGHVVGQSRCDRS